MGEPNMTDLVNRLRECAHCGAEVELRKGQCAGDPDYIVHKPKAGGHECGVVFSNFSTGGDVVDLWNARAEDARLQARIAELEGVLEQIKAVPTKEWSIDTAKSIARTAL